MVMVSKAYDTAADRQETRSRTSVKKVYTGTMLAETYALLLDNTFPLAAVETKKYNNL